MNETIRKFGRVCAVVGGQWGDEGKGKLVDILAENYDIVARATGGANAGHTIYIGDKKFVFHLAPSGMLHEGKICVMGNGMVVHLPTILEEMDVLRKAGVDLENRLFLSDRSHIVFEYHKEIDRLQEEMKAGGKIGTTGRGIGPAYSDKTSRTGIRAGELNNWSKFEEHFRANVSLLSKMYDFDFSAEKELAAIKEILPKIKPMIIDTSLFLSEALKKGQTILCEGANGALLDVDHGSYPFVTSSNASIGGIIAGSGLAPKHLQSVIGIMKAYLTRVGSGPFPTELKDSLGDKIREIGGEFGSTTGRPRRCGWFDAVAARYSARINGFTGINLTKVDVLNQLETIKVGISYKHNGEKITEFPSDISALEDCEVEYKEFPGWMADASKAKTFEDLPQNCRNYVKALENLIGCPIQFIGIGKNREEMIARY